MSTTLTWLGHATWLVDTGTQRLLIDPFLDDSPTAPLKSGEVSADFILVSHGHFDHIADVAKIAARTGATVISNYEICAWLAQQGVEKTVGHNLGGSSQYAFGRVKLTIAFHSSVLPDGTNGGNPSGFLLTLVSGDRLYFACDTALFGDMQLIGRGGLDVAVLPIGDLFTMGPEDALDAVRLLQPRQVLPSHYDTWPPIAQDADAWCQRVTAVTGVPAVALRPGASFTVS